MFLSFKDLHRTTGVRPNGTPRASAKCFGPLFSYCRWRVSMQVEQATEQAPSFRLDVPLHSLLTKPSAPLPGLQPIGEPQRFPDPVFPQRPELLGSIDEN